MMANHSLLRVGAIIVPLLLAAFTLFMMVSPYKGVVVITDSMRPAIPKWSFVILSPVDAPTVAAGDIVLFVAQGEGTLVLHRVVEADPHNERLMTKGDSNHQADLFPVAWRSLQGSYAAHVPVVGWIVFYARQYKLLLSLLLLAALLAALVVALLRRKKESP